MPLKMKELPESERPYEKLKMYGAQKLSNAELLAIIIKTGTKEENSIDIANRILLLGNNLLELQEISIEKLKTIKGIGEVKAIQLKAMCELTKRMNAENKNMSITIEKPEDIAKIFMNELKNETQEIVKVIILNSKNLILKIIEVTKGEINSAGANASLILSEAVKMQAPKIILIHNHPSGDPTPSRQDYETTKQIKKASDILGIKLLDHIVIGNNQYKSIFSERDFKNEIDGL